MSTPVLVVGEALIDIVTTREGATEHIGGSPANVAVGVARLGHPTSVATYIGRDERGRRITELMRREHIDVAAGSTDAAHTSTAAAVLDRSGAASYHFDLEFRLPHHLRAPDEGHVHTGSIAAVLAPGGRQVREFLERARATCTISYDPNCRPTVMGDPEQARPVVESMVALADVVKASDEDVAWLYDGEGPVQALQRWAGLGPRLAVITRGADGALMRLGEDVVEVASPAGVDVVDTVGAGDTFMAGLISGLLDAGLLGGTAARERLARATVDDVEPALRRAVDAATIVVGRRGANPPRRDELPPA